MQMAVFLSSSLIILLETLAGSPADCDGDLEDEDQQSPLTQLSVSSEMVAPRAGSQHSLALSANTEMSRLFLAVLLFTTSCFFNTINRKL